MVQTSRLPIEILDIIFTLILKSGYLDIDSARPVYQYTLYSACLVCREWRVVGTHLLYRRPYLEGKHYQKFVDTVCPSKNAHVRRSALAPLVQYLDLSKLVHQSSRSMTARLLSRMKGTLKGFVAPRASFGVNACAALSKCQKLESLDLTLIYDVINLETLFHTLKSLTSLKVLHFPLCGYENDPYKETQPSWPLNLEEIVLDSCISTTPFALKSDTSPELVMRFPESLTKLRMTFSTLSKDFMNQALIKTLGPHLMHLDLSNYRGIEDSQDFEILASCPNLQHLKINLMLINEFVTPYEDGVGSSSLNINHPLRFFGIDMNRVQHSDFRFEMAFKTLMEAMSSENAFKSIRTVQLYGEINIPLPKKNFNRLSMTLWERHGSKSDVGIFWDPHVIGQNLTCWSGEEFEEMVPTEIELYMSVAERISIR